MLTIALLLLLSAFVVTIAASLGKAPILDRGPAAGRGRPAAKSAAPLTPRTP
jgi:hypothetical protein